MYKWIVGVLTMPPVIILKPLLWTDSRSSSSVPEQLQNRMLPYSNPGLSKDVYIIVNVFLSIKVFSVAKMFNFLLAFSQIVLQWSFHVRFEFISIPRCLCFVTVSKSELLNVRGNFLCWRLVKSARSDYLERCLLTRLPYQNTRGDWFWGQLDCEILANLLKLEVLKYIIMHSSRTFPKLELWVSFDQSTSNFVGGYIISRHKWGSVPW